MADVDPNDDGDYDVGYGKPPLHSRFKPGVCPNAKGRGKGVKNFQTEINEELRAKITINENGRRKKITKRRAIAKQIVNKSTMGDLKAIPVLLNETRDKDADGKGLQAILDTADDETVMANLIQRLREQVQSPGGPVPTPSNPSDPTDSGECS
jgi:hypothetical protein